MIEAISCCTLRFLLRKEKGRKAKNKASEIGKSMRKWQRKLFCLAGIEREKTGRKCWHDKGIP
jgi:hypothetical protein